MELQTFKKNYREGFFSRLVKKAELILFAKRVVRATEKCEKAKLDLLYSLPGVFSLELACGGASIRLIKEADTFRIMEKSERSVILLRVIFSDRGSERALLYKKASLCRLLAEGRILYFGKSKYMSVLTRVSEEGDRAFLSENKRNELYPLEK